MKTPLVDITAGWTGLLGPFTLKLDGAAFDLTGFTVTLALHRESGAVVTPAGTITVLDQMTNKGQVTYQPNASDFTLEAGRRSLVQYYALRWKVVDGASHAVHFPHGDPERVAVWR